MRLRQEHCKEGLAWSRSSSASVLSSSDRPLCCTLRSLTRTCAVEVSPFLELDSQGAGSSSYFKAFNSGSGTYPLKLIWRVDSPESVVNLQYLTISAIFKFRRISFCFG